LQKKKESKKGAISVSLGFSLRIAIIG